MSRQIYTCYENSSISEWVYFYCCPLNCMSDGRYVHYQWYVSNKSEFKFRKLTFFNGEVDYRNSTTLKIVESYAELFCVVCHNRFLPLGEIETLIGLHRLGGAKAVVSFAQSWGMSNVDIVKDFLKQKGLCVGLVV